MSRYAVIDVGTNSVLLLIAEPDEAGWDVIVDTTTITRMGEGLSRTGSIGDDPLRRNVECLTRYRQLCDEHAVSEIAAVGTSALRDAKNSQEVLEEIGKATGIRIEIIDGETEAELSYLAVRSDASLQLPETGRVAVIDIGGGSAELILGQERLEFAESVNIGAVRMTEQFLRSDPPTDEEVAAMRNRIREGLHDLFSNLQERVDIASCPLAVAGVGGTMVNLGHVQQGGGDFRKAHGSRLQLEQVRSLIQRFCSVNLEHRREIPGLEPARADVIIAGAVILEELLSHLHQTAVQVSIRGLRYGLLYQRFGS